MEPIRAGDSGETVKHSHQRFRLACELVRNGRIGRLADVTAILPAGRREGPFKSQPVPEGYNWDFWQGQTPAVDYVAERNVVDRQIRNLRARLQNDWKRPRFIATIPGRRYRFLPTFTTEASEEQEG